MGRDSVCCVDESTSGVVEIEWSMNVGFGQAGIAGAEEESSCTAV